MDSIKRIWAAIVVVAIIATTGVFLPHALKGLGGVTNYDALELSSGLYVSNASTTLIGKLKVGSTATAINGISTGICYVAASAQTIAGSASQLFDCQGTAASGVTGINTATSSLTGVTANDHCSLTLSTTTALGLSTTSATIVNTTPLLSSAASASTTGTGSGTIQGLVYNSSTSPYRWAIGGNSSGTAEYICTR